ncbi:hypothetical protein SALBM311S_04314 [Streptomyces alboniger]
MLLFAPLLWFTGRRKAALSTGLTFAGCTAVAWAAMEHDSYTYWVHHLAGTGLGGNADDLANQSLHGSLLRTGLSGPLEISLFLLLGVGVAVLGLRRAVRYARDGQLLLAVAITGCAAIAVSPTTWQHQLLWVLLAVVGRVGKRTVRPVRVAGRRRPGDDAAREDDAAGHEPALDGLRDNVVLLAAVVAATVVPFLSRTSPHYRSPVPTEYAPQLPARLRHVPRLPLPAPGPRPPEPPAGTAAHPRHLNRQRDKASTKRARVPEWLLPCVPGCDAWPTRGTSTRISTPRPRTRDGRRRKHQSRAEKETAEADVSCKERAGLVKVLTVTEQSIQEREIRKHKAYFQRLAAAKERHLAAAREVIEQG